jgi:predicted nucleic acid-binding protein
MRAQTGLKLPDCCVLLAAEDEEAQGVASFDDRLAAVVAPMGLRLYGG